MTGHAYRGASFEEELKTTHEAYRTAGLAVVTKHEEYQKRGLLTKPRASSIMCLLGRKGQFLFDNGAWTPIRTLPAS